MALSYEGHNNYSLWSFAPLRTEQNTQKYKQLHIVNIAIFCTSTEHTVCSISPRFVAQRTPWYNDTIYWRSGNDRIL